MFECELIVGSGASAVSLDLYDDLPLSLNLNIADIKEPEKRNGDYTKTIKLKGTPINNKFFEQTYDVNIATSTWNPNIKTPAYFLKQGTKPMVGDLRLMSIEVIRKNEFEDITYNVVLMGRNTNIFTTIGDAKLEDLDLSTYNHNYTLAVQQSAENNQIYIAGILSAANNGVGYRYPVVDYGNSGNFNCNYYHVNHLRPAIFAKTYWDKIFSVAGKTYTSTFLNDTTDLFCKELILHNGDKITMTPATQALRECYVGNTGVITSQTKALQSTGSTFSDWWSGDTFASLSSSYDMKYNDDSTLPFIDTGNVYSPVTGKLTLAATGNYNLSFVTNFEIKLATTPAGTNSVNLSVAGAWPVAYKVLRSTDGGVTWNIIYQLNDVSLTTVLSTSYQSFNKTFTVSGTFNQNDQFRLLVHPLYSPSGYGIVFKDISNNNITAGTASMEWRFKSTAVFNCKLPIADVTEGMPMVINDAIPKEIKQRDFLLSMIKKYNLYIDEDKANPNNYLIEPRDDFYAAGTTLDWTSKYAVDKETRIEPMGAINVKTFMWKYKEDQDYYNKQYQESWGESYGTKTEIITNDFLKSELKNEVIFSPTPVVDNINNDMIIPMIFSWDGVNTKPMKHNIRCVLWRGSVTLSNTWTYGSITGNVTKTSYAACAMSDNPLAATETIEFGVPNEIFYDGIGPTYTTNNLYNRFYSRQIQEITDRDSKIVTMWMYLEPQDISKFDFRNKIYIDKTLYYVNKIMDYNPLKNQLTKVEFLKIKLGNTYVPVSEIDIGDLETNRLATGMTTRPFGTKGTLIGEASNLMSGDNISSRMSGGLMSGNRIGVGDSCYLISVISSDYVNISNNASGITIKNSSGINVGASANRIDLTNCDNITIDELVYDFVGVGLSGVTVTTSDSGVYRNDMIQYNPSINSATKTASFSVDASIGIYYIDCTAGNITATFDMTASTNKTVTFIRIDASAYVFKIAGYVGGVPVKLEGTDSPIDLGMVQYESKPINTNGTVFYIV